MARVAPLAGAAGRSRAGRARASRAPIRLVDAIEAAARKPEPVEKRRRAAADHSRARAQAGAARKTRRLEMQEELVRRRPYRLPPLSLLDPPQKTPQPIDEEALLRSSQILESKLADFGIAGKVVAVRPGPVITTFEIEPAPGVKVNRIVNLADDLPWRCAPRRRPHPGADAGQGGGRHRGREPAARDRSTCARSRGRRVPRTSSRS